MKRAAQIARFALALVLVLAGAEAALRVLKPATLQYYRDMKLLHSYHPEYQVGLAPNADVYVKHHAGLWEGRFTTNSRGMRGTGEIDPEADYIACLGDSLVFALGVSDEDTFCRRLDGITIRGKKYRAANFGVDAYGSLEYALRLEDMAPAVPRLKKVLLFISPNDFSMPPALEAQGILPDDVIAEKKRNNQEYLTAFRIQFKLTEASYLLQAAKLAFEQQRVQIPANMADYKRELVRAGVLSPSPGASQPEGMRKYLGTVFYRFPARPDCGPVQADFLCPEAVPAGIECTDPIEVERLASRELPSVTREAYDRMIAYAKERKFELIPVILPMQVEEIHCYQHGRSHPLRRYALQAMKYFAAKNVRVIDLMPETKQMCGELLTDERGRQFRSRVRDYFIPGDGHLTVPGNLWTERSLKTALEKGAF